MIAPRNSTIATKTFQLVHEQRTALAVLKFPSVSGGLGFHPPGGCIHIPVYDWSPLRVGVTAHMLFALRLSLG